MNNFINYNLYSYLSKNLKIGTTFISGRNFSGHICVLHKSGGIKRNYCFIDFYRRINSFGIIYKIIKDLNRTAFLGAIIYENGLFSYIILSDNLKIGDIIYSGTLKNFNNKLKNGFALSFKSINLFTIVNNIELKPYMGASLSRAAGTSCLLVGKKKKNVIIKFKSGWNIYISKYCIATLGNVSNILHKFLNYKKAGRVINLGKRPVVRGLAKNACDHPHGGGEGRKSALASPKSPWGWLTKNTPSKKKKYQILKKKIFKILR
jgi:large subunit ribosomal protein L2